MSKAGTPFLYILYSKREKESGIWVEILIEEGEINKTNVLRQNLTLSKCSQNLKKGVLGH